MKTKSSFVFLNVEIPFSFKEFSCIVAVQISGDSPSAMEFDISDCMSCTFLGSTVEYPKVRHSFASLFSVDLDSVIDEKIAEELTVPVMSSLFLEATSSIFENFKK